MTKPVLKVSFLFSYLALIASCASVDVAKLKPYPAKPVNCALDVYSETSAIKKPYEVACVLGSSTGTSQFEDRSVQHAIDLAKEEACKCGADAIVIDSVSKTGMSLTGYGQGAASIKAIVYK